jgi:hypothetical protein
MDESAVRAIVERVIPHVKWRLQLQKWVFTVKYDSLNDPGAERDHKATCTPDPAERQAVIEIDPGRHKSESDVLRSVVHELLHCMTADLETYRKAVGQHVGGASFDALDQFWHFGTERVVRRLENVLYWGLGWTPERLTAPVTDEERELFRSRMKETGDATNRCC